MRKRLLTGLFALLISLTVLASCGYPAKAEEPEKGKQTEEAKKKTVYKTGLYNVNGVYKYYKDGKFTPITDVISVSATKQVYVKKGIFTKATGLVKRKSDKKLVYVKKGVFTKATGLAKRISNGKWYYVKKGVFKKATGIVKVIGSKKYGYVKNGKFTQFTGLAKRISDKKWFYVYKGAQTNNVNLFVLTPEQEAAGYLKQYVQAYARAIADTITNSSMSEDEKILACFNYVITNFNSGRNPRIPHFTGKNWEYIYAYDMFGPGTATYPAHTGNCMSYGAAFAFIAKAAGCKSVYAINNGYHGWAEVNGLVYDPEQYHDTDNRKIYAKSYKDSMVSGYWDSVSGANSKRFRKLIKPF